MRVPRDGPLLRSAGGVLAGALALLLVGCTGSGSDPDPAPGPVTVTSGSAAAPSNGPAQPAVATTDTTGAPLPDAVVDTAGRIGAALSSGDPTPLRDLYVPARGAASWRVVADRLSDPANQAKLASALRTPPQPRPEIAYLFSDGDHGLGMTDTGRLAFVGVGQRPPTESPGGGAETAGRPFWAGEFYGHGRSLYYDDPSGRGTMTFRTYETCPSSRAGVPCEPRGPEQVGEVLLKIDGPDGGPYTAEVLESNDEPELPVGDVLPVEETAPGVVSVGSGDRTFTFCRSGISHIGCGA